jgi:DNA-binding MarR family transcriptional regulator
MEVDSTAGFPAARRRPPPEERFVQNSRGSGLTRSQWQVLTYLAQNEGINQARLAELIEIEPITLSRIVDKLEAMQLIKRNPHPTDRRRWLLHLMPAARSRLEQVGEYGRWHPQRGFGWRVRSRQTASVEDVAGSEREPDPSMRCATCGTKTSKPWLIEKIG